MPKSSENENERVQKIKPKIKKETIKF